MTDMLYVRAARVETNKNGASENDEIEEWVEVLEPELPIPESHVEQTTDLSTKQAPSESTHPPGAH